MGQAPEILVIDDDKEDHYILNEYFRETGVNELVYFMDSGFKAINYLNAIKEVRHLPSLIILDQNMPILNGTQTLLRIKKTDRLKEIPVIMFSTSENEMEKKKCLESGALEYLVKPTTYKEGLILVEKFASFIDN